MVLEVRSATIVDRKNAVSLWKKFADFLNKKYPNANATVATPMTGDKVGLHRIVLIIWHDSPSAWGKCSEELSADAEWAALFKEHQEKQYTVWGSMAIKLYNVAD